MSNSTINHTRELKLEELEVVSGGHINGALEGVCSKDKAIVGILQVGLTFIVIRK